MNERKQIEEMANEIYETLMLEAECPLSGMDCAIIASLLISKGYRKASGVASEILELVETVVNKLTSCYIQLFPYRSHEILTELRDEIREKYTEEGK
jgi:hypothetical protein